MRVSIIRNQSIKKINKFSPKCKSVISTESINQYQSKQQEDITPPLSQEEVIKKEVQRRIPNPYNETYYTAIIREIYLTHGVQISYKDTTKVFNSWCSEYTDTVLAKEQAKLFEEARNKMQFSEWVP